LPVFAALPGAAPDRPAAPTNGFGGKRGASRARSEAKPSGVNREAV